uniref:Ig-like domain-containing protein n=1 Tax=Caenorhabditis japonica TaxID=281687 RepID=A0A8R1HQD1_CAEJA
MEGDEKKGGGLPPTSQRHLNIDTTICQSVSQPTSPSMSYSTDRETVMRSSSGHATVAETHLIRSIGSQSQSYTEEHWSSEITSFVALAPPKFVQVIKAYRVLASDTISLVVEVASDPPAIFEWFCNDKSVLQDRNRFQVGHGINISRLKVSQPEQGMYKCVTRNPAGVSTSYGYITVNADREHLSSSKEDVRLQRKHSVTYHQAPRFLTQVPNLFVTAGSHVIIDVEVDANPPARFSWFVNGKEYRDSTQNVEMFSPDVNRSVVRFSIPVAGEYKVVASNVHGSAMSCGHVDIQKVVEMENIESSVTTSTVLDPMTSSMRALGNNGRNSRQAVNLFELNYTQRSSSVPRGVRHLESHIEVSNTSPEKTRQQERHSRTDAASITESRVHHNPPKPPRAGMTRRFLPEPPKFVTPLPSLITVNVDEKLVLSVDVQAIPAAEFAWHVNGFEVKKSQNIVLLNEHNKSTLVLHPPVKQGKYKVTARNDVGSESVTTQVQRIGELEDGARGSEPPDIVESAVTVTCSHDEDVASHSSLQTVRRLQEMQEEEDSIKPFIDATSPKLKEPSEHPFANVLKKRDVVSPSGKHLPFAPRITAHPSESIFRILDGSSLKFRIMTSSLPPATFLWMMNNFELRSNQNITISNHEENVSEIEFKKVSSGNLSVTAKNPLGEDKWNGKVVVEYASPERKTITTIEKITETFTLEEAVINQLVPTAAEAGDRIVIIVRFDENKTSACQFVWTINGVEIEKIEENLVAVESTEFESVLIVEKLEESICGEVVCVVKNQHGEVFSSSAHLRIRDDESSFEIVPPDLPEECAPKIVEPLHSANFLDGQPMSLRCKITAIPSAAIVWSKDDVNVDDWVLNKDVSTTVLDGGVCELLNPECFSEDAGLYKCTATNPHGTAETAAFINVEGAEYVKDHEEAEVSESVLTDDLADTSIILPPKFIEHLTAETDNYQEIGYVRLVATIQSVAPITVTWQKDGEDVYENEKFEVLQFADGAQIMTIREPTSLDSGVYTCTAESEHGVSNSSCQVELTSSESSSPKSFEKVDITPPEEVKETGIDDDIEVVSKEEVTGTAQIEKREEEFKLLVKVADQVASTLVAKVFLEAVHEAVKKIVETEDEEEDNQIEPTQEPRFETSTDEYHVKENGTIKMSATISGHPTPFLEWFFEKEKLQVSQNIAMSYEAGTSAIILKNVAKRQSGTYYLHAKNYHGQAVLPMKLIIDPIEAVTHIFESETEAQIEASDVPDQDKNEQEQEVQERTRERQLREAAEKVSEQLTQIWVQDAQSEAVKIQKDQETQVVMEEPEPVQQATEIQVHEQIQLNQNASTPEESVLVAVPEEEKKLSPARTSSPMNYEEKVKAIESNLLRVSSQEQLEPIEATNMLLNTAMQLKNDHVCDETTTVVVTQQPQKFDQLVTVVESNVEHHSLRLSTTSVPLKFIDLETIIQKPSTSCESIDRMFVEKSRRTANAQHRIVVLQGMSNTFHNAITWSLKKVKKLVGDAEAKAYAEVEVVKQAETNEQVMTIIDNDTIVPQLLQVAAAANKLKLENVSVALVKDGDFAHQELVIEYESSIDEPVIQSMHNTSHLIFQQQQPTGPEQHVWSRRSKYDEDEAHVVAVFVEVDANCPDQSVEIVATVNAAYEGSGLRENFNDDPLTEVSQSLATESSAAPQAPKFLRKLVNCFGRIGEPIQLKCLVAGMPQPEVEWTVDGDPIVPNDEYEIVYEDGVCILRIESTLIEDEGEYCCTASNVAGSAFSKCYLKLSEVEDDAADLLRQLSEIKIVDPSVSTGYPLSQMSGTDDENTSRLLSNAQLITDKDFPTTATFNEDMSRTESFRRFYESAETTVKVTELFQGETVEAQFKEPENAPVVSTSTTDVFFSNQKTNVMESTVSTIGNVHMSVSSSTNSWDYMLNDPFPESNEVAVNVSDLYEPRVPLLPQKLSYKGQEIFANTVEKEPIRSQGDVENLKKCVETLLLFDAEMNTKQIKQPKESSPKKEKIEEQIKATQKILEEVQRDLNEMEIASESSSKSPSKSASKKSYEPKDLEDIEAAIFTISDQLAEKQANEKVLREALQDMILNKSSPVKEVKSTSEVAIKEELETETRKTIEPEAELHPIVKLKQAISAIENSLLEDIEVTEIMKRKGNDKDKRKATRIKRVPSAHSARITPITTNLRERLNQLHQLTVSEDSTSKQNQEAAEIQELFVKIEKEINTIAELCKEKMTKQGADTVTHVLNSVLQHLASIINVLRVAQDLQPIEVHSVNSEEATVWYSFEVHPEAEDIIGIVEEEPTNRRPLSTPRTSSSSKLTASQESRETITMTQSSDDTIAAPVAPARDSRSTSRNKDKLVKISNEEVSPQPPPRRSRQSGDELSPEPRPVAPPRKKSKEARSPDPPVPVRPPRSKSRRSDSELSPEPFAPAPVRPPRSKSKTLEREKVLVENMNESSPRSKSKTLEKEKVHVESLDDSSPRKKSKTLDREKVQVESMDESTLSCIHIQKSNFAFVSKNHESESAAVIVDLRNNAELDCTVPDMEDMQSIQMLCEESDYPSDTDRSLLLAGTVRYFNRTSPSLHDVSPFPYESISVDLKSQQDDIDEKIETADNEQEVYLNVELHSVPSLSSLVAINTNMAISEKSSLRAADEGEEVTAELSFVGRSIVSTETLDVVLEEKDMSQMNGPTSVLLDNDRAFSSNTIRETDILSDESITVDSVSYQAAVSEIPRKTVNAPLPKIKEPVEIKENFSLTRKPARSRVTGIVVNSLVYTISASITADNTFDVDVVQEPQRYNISIKVIEDIVDFTSLTIMSDCEDEMPAEVYMTVPQDTTKLTALSYDDVSVATTRTGITVSIVARSLNDGIYASLEEIAWGEVEMTVPDVMQMSTEEKSSLQFNVTVSESNLEEAKSLKSQVSFRSSQNSVSEIENTLSSTGTISIPSYVVKLDSTATITCELNNYLPKNCSIDWYCGKSRIIIDNEQFDRISHDLLEVLIIRSVEPINGNLYSLKINDDLFPVAYLIVENTNLTTSASILTRPETQFVMEGQPTVIAVQVDDQRVVVNWLKDRRPLHESERIKLEMDGLGNHRVVIPNTTIADQGTYLALTSSQSVAITLVVEERIDEKEVTVIASGTESEDDDVQEYLVPPGSTATIACELEDCEQQRSIRWLRDGKDIRFEPGKTEHVQNGLKHYLVVHDATSLDSGLYSVCISNVEFRVAHLCVNSVTSTLHALKRKRISNNSLHN